MAATVPPIAGDGSPRPNAPSAPPPSVEMRRSRRVRQVARVCVGAGLVIASLVLSRRAVARHWAESVPRFLGPAQSPNRDVVPRLPRAEASRLGAEAFGLATLNVLSGAFFVAAGLGWAFDISSASELRARLRTQPVDRPRTATDTQDDRQLEEWASSLLKSPALRSIAAAASRDNTDQERK